MQSMSMRCCSATLFSRLTFRCNAVKMLLRSSRECPQSTLSFSSALLGCPASFVLGTSSPPSAPASTTAPSTMAPLGGIAKYSSSSRRTMMACLRKRGFCMLDWLANESARSRWGPEGGP